MYLKIDRMVNLEFSAPLRTQNIQDQPVLPLAPMSPHHWGPGGAALISVWLVLFTMLQATYISFLAVIIRAQLESSGILMFLSGHPGSL